MLSQCCISQEQDQRADAEENAQRLMAKKAELESNIQELSERFDEEVENNSNIAAARRKLEAEIDHLQENLEDLQNHLSAIEQEKIQKERDCQSLDNELEKVNDNLGRANKEKKAMEERIEVISNVQAYFSHTAENPKEGSGMTGSDFYFHDRPLSSLHRDAPAYSLINNIMHDDVLKYDM